MLDGTASRILADTRAASIYYPDAKSRHLVYQMFDVDSAKRDMYLSDLGTLRRLVSPDRLSIHLVKCSIRRTLLQECLERRWDKGERFLHEHVLCGLKNGDLMDVELKKIYTVK